MNLEANKQNAIAFYRTAYEGSPRQAIKQIPQKSANANSMY